MIDWTNLFFNALWVLGCALALAAVSYAGYRASQQPHGLRRELAARSSQMALFVAGALFCAGLAGTSDRWWEIAAWAVLGVLFALQAALAYRAPAVGAEGGSLDG